MFQLLYIVIIIYGNLLKHNLFYVRNFNYYKFQINISCMYICSNYIISLIEIFRNSYLNEMI